MPPNRSGEAVSCGYDIKRACFFLRIASLLSTARAKFGNTDSAGDGQSSGCPTLDWLRSRLSVTRVIGEKEFATICPSCTDAERHRREHGFGEPGHATSRAAHLYVTDVCTALTYIVLADSLRNRFFLEAASRLLDERRIWRFLLLARASSRGWQRHSPVRRMPQSQMGTAWRGQKRRRTRDLL